MAVGLEPSAVGGALTPEPFNPESPVNILLSRALPPPLDTGSDAAASAAK